ncbi:MAG: type II toxin-antitoxin system RelE/ParE family toxin [Bacteroidales bacterium]|nr:type II toxin-antitoxin system RelE/ParE family toxin [Bacteroidales bacterium]
MVRELIWSKFALKQKQNIFEYWNKRNKSKSYSIKLNNLFNNAAELLIAHPNIGEKTDYNNVRLKLVRDYWMAYRITDKHIQILTVWDTRRNPDDFDNILEIIGFV